MFLFRKYLNITLIVGMVGILILLTATFMQGSETDHLSSPLTFEERLHCQNSIEKIYWQYKIWPAENPFPKPAFEEIRSEEIIKAKVENTLKKSNAIVSIIHSSITGEQLQQEMNRMAENTRKPEIIKEIWEVLENDPHLIAECLARPNLADRLIREIYASDERFQNAIKTIATTESQQFITSHTKIFSHGNYQLFEWIKSSIEDDCSCEISAGNRLPRKLSNNKWNIMIKELASDFKIMEAQQGSEVENAVAGFSFDNRTKEQNSAMLFDALPVGTPSVLRENSDFYYILEIVEKQQNKIKIAVVTWEKISFDSWWKEQRNYFSTVMNEPTINYILPEITNSSCSMDIWKNIGVDARYFHTAVWTGTEMIIWGGVSASYLNSGARYNPAVDLWYPMSLINAPAGRARHTAIWTGAAMIIWGGYDSNYLSSGARYNAEFDEWETISSSGAPLARYGHTAVWTGTEMIIWGGLGYTYMGNGGKYNASNDSWIELPIASNSPSPRINHTAAWTGTEMIIWGGNSNNNLATGARYNPVLKTWSEASSSNAPLARQNHTAVWTGTEMIIWGGSDEYKFNSGSRYNPSSNTWIQTNLTNAPSARASHSAVWTGEKMIIWGGYDGSYFNTGSQYNPATDTWETVSTINATPERAYHTAVWTGTEMIIWGGKNTYPLNSGARYNPSLNSWIIMLITIQYRTAHTAVWTGTEMIIWGGLYIFSGVEYPQKSGGKYDSITDSWQQTSTIGSPFERYEHKAIWTGTEMIVWAGIKGNDLTYTGGRYNPATDSWNATSITNVPAGRYLHTAIWIGSEMLVWGGYTQAGAADTGGKYNPATNSWIATSITGVPDARFRHSAVWTGSLMIVWSGQGFDKFGNILYYDTGATYNPQNEVWEPISTTDVPHARVYNTALWTGDKMLIWGGFYCENAGQNKYYLNTGALYNPLTDSWSPTSLNNVPEGRDLHSSIWESDEIIIWGGKDYGTYLNSGSRFDPLTNTWTEISAYNAPAKRMEHTAVWTGTEMIIWGGFDGSKYLDSGGIYCRMPCSPPYFGGIQTASDIDGCEASGINITWQQPASWGGCASSGTYSIKQYPNVNCLDQGINIATGIPSGQTSFTYTPSPGDQKYYQVIAVNNGIPPLASKGTASCLAGLDKIPSAPTGLLPITTTDFNLCANNGVQISWNVDAGNWGDYGSGTRMYNVWRNAEKIADGLPYSTTFFLDLFGIDNSSYDYSVEYVNGCDLSSTTASVPGSDSVGSPPSGLTNNTAVDMSSCSDSGIEINWQKDVSDWGDSFIGERTYFVLRNGTQVSNALPYGVTTYVDTSGEPQTTYQYSIRYVNGCTMSNDTDGTPSADNICFLIAQKPQIDDSSSPSPKANGIIDEDEIVTLAGVLKNEGTGYAYAVTGILGSFDTNIIINNAYATYPDLAPDEFSTCDECYSLTAPSANRPALHWDFTAIEIPSCTDCPDLSYNFTYHVGESFADVTPYSPFYPFVESLLHSNVTSGCNATQFCPGDLVQRQHMAKFICNAMNAFNQGSCAVSPCSNIFNDVPGGNPFCPYIEALYNNEIVSGCSASPLLYCPTSFTQRQVMAKFICLAMETTDPGSCITVPCAGVFTDVSTDNLFCSFIEGVYNAGVVSGCQSNPLMYCPNNNTSRIQMSKFLVNAFNLSL
ncbi:MAG: hypothetical protein A2Y62_05740 [Candidatus Fischerbacteria bacterium RBG_13_37_8]|uniref:SLH domain-containing protein n=1 Tax=Candidatus Fischerbacteria bacterium RBG_13_37_8 TaxID=1817863 RepID=A0A1F5VD97_9BACT|nr:MAG: hypothetical protein A2Y62_05740 [Candidatus Fischerbacteria bacterium RBG_13_37_8]